MVQSTVLIKSTNKFSEIYNKHMHSLIFCINRSVYPHFNTNLKLLNNNFSFLTILHHLIQWSSPSVGKTNG